MDRFIVGSGRCGSTLLTNMMAKHPEMLVLSEFFSTLDRTECFAAVPVSGMHFAELLMRSNPIADIPMLRGRAAKEILSDTSTLKALPALLIVTLPAVSEKSQSLFEEVIDAMRDNPTQRLSAHYRRLFEWLRVRLQRSCWIERSGTSSEYLQELIEMFPDALYVHLHRDGPESAISMHDHTYFQLCASFFLDPPTRAEVEATEYGGKPISATDPFTRRLTTDRQPVERFGNYWSYQQVMGFRGLSRLNSSQRLDIRFEDLVIQPRRTLERIADFLQLPGGADWIDAAARLVDRQPPQRFRNLPRHQQEALTKSCEVGQLLLGRADSAWIKPTLQLIKEVAAATQSSQGASAVSAAGPLP
jgi:putative sulfotransferase